MSESFMGGSKHQETDECKRQCPFIVSMCLELVMNHKTQVSLYIAHENTVQCKQH